jgi:hypothetical protein
VFTGKISYSWYLWHWPPLAFLRYYLDRPLLAHETLICVVIGLLAALLSYRYVERPFRDPELFLRLARPAFRGAIAVTLVLIGLGSLFQETRGLPVRLNAEAKAFMADRFAPALRSASKKCIRSEESPSSTILCRFGAQGKQGAELVLLGDSHAGHYFPAIAEIADRRQLSGFMGNAAACVPIPGIWGQGRVEHRNQRCSEIKDRVLSHIANSQTVRLVMFAGRWNLYVAGNVTPAGNKTRYYSVESGFTVEDSRSLYKAALREVIASLERRGIKVLLLKQVPEFPKSVLSCNLKMVQLGSPSPDCNNVTIKVLDEYQNFVNSFFNDLQKEFRNVHVFSPNDYLCSSGLCRSYSADGTLLYVDDDHLNAAGAKFLEPHIERVIDKILQADVASVTSRDAKPSLANQ